MTTLHFDFQETTYIVNNSVYFSLDRSLIYNSYPQLRRRKLDEDWARRGGEDAPCEQVEVVRPYLFFHFFSELCLGKAMVAYTKPQQWKKEERERLRGERDQIKFIGLGFEKWYGKEGGRTTGEFMDTEVPYGSEEERTPEEGMSRLH